MKKIVLLIITCILTVTGKGQITISGIITDGAYKIPMAIAKVCEKGTDNCVHSSLNGRYSLDVMDTSAQIEFSYNGYDTINIKVSDKNMYDVILEKNDNDELHDSIFTLKYEDRYSNKIIFENFNNSYTGLDTTFIKSHFNGNSFEKKYCNHTIFVTNIKKIATDKYELRVHFKPNNVVDFQKQIMQGLIGYSWYLMTIDTLLSADIKYIKKNIYIPKYNL